VAINLAKKIFTDMEQAESVKYADMLVIQKETGEN